MEMISFLGDKFLNCLILFFRLKKVGSFIAILSASWVQWDILEPIKRMCDKGIVTEKHLLLVLT